MKNILIVTRYYAPSIGGIETIAKKQAEYLKNKGYKVTVLTCNKEANSQTTIELMHGIRVIRCASFGTYFSMPISISFFFTLLKERKNHDIVHSHEPFPLTSLVGFFKKPKKVHYIMHWHLDIVRQKKFKKLAESFQRAFAIKSTKIVTTSESLKNNSSVISLFKDKTEVIPNFINTKFFLEQKSIQPKIELPSKYILFLGRLSYYKGLLFLLESYKLSEQKIPLLIVGQGEVDLTFKIKEFSDNNSNVIFYNNFVSEEEKKYLLEHCSFFVFPSIYASEAFGIMQLEAMLYKKAIINTDLNTGVPWVARHNLEALTVPVEDTKALALALNQLSANEELCETLGQNGFNRVLECFDEEKVLEKIVELYEGLQSYV